MTEQDIFATTLIEIAKAIREFEFQRRMPPEEFESKFAPERKHLDRTFRRRVNALAKPTTGDDVCQLGGARIAQLVLAPAVQASIHEVSSFGDKPRGFADIGKGKP